jgi:TatD DNase family protein
MIDTHAHIYLEQFKDDLSEVLDRAADAGVDQILMPAIGAESFRQMKRMSHKSIQFHPMAGLHPCEVDDQTDIDQWLSILNQELEVGSYVAVGEIGLASYWDKTHIELQQSIFKAQIEVAKERQIPVVIHNRESTDDMLAIVAEQQDGGLRGVWHCFNGTVEEGERAIDLGLFLGIGGVLTFKNGGVDKTVSQLPIDRMILETDSPYLAPVPNRGKRNEPAYVREVAKKLCEVKNLDLREVDTITTENAKRLFDL